MVPIAPLAAASLPLPEDDPLRSAGQVEEARPPFPASHNAWPTGLRGFLDNRRPASDLSPRLTLRAILRETVVLVIIIAMLLAAMSGFGIVLRDVFHDFRNHPH